MSGPTVYAGGSFDSIGGQARNRIAALDAGTGLATAWNPSANGRVFELVVSGNTIYAGGQFTNIGGAPRFGVAALDAASGSATSWNANSNSAVYALALAGSTIYAGGYFTTIGGQSRNYIAELDTMSGLATNWNPNAGPEGVYELEVAGSVVYAGGTFTNIGGEDRHRLAALDRTTGSATAWTAHAGGPTDISAPAIVMALSVNGSRILVGGSLRGVGMQLRNRLAAVDVTSDEVTPWNPNADAHILAMALSGSTLYVTGLFTSIGGSPRPGVAALEAATGLATEWNPTISSSPSSPVYAVAVTDSAVYFGGHFYTYTSLGDRSRVAAFDRATAAVTPWNPWPDNTVTALAVDGSTVYVGGWFTSIGGQPRRKLAAVDAATGNAIGGWQADVSGNGPVQTLTVNESVLYVGGDFYEVGGVPRAIAALDAATGTVTAWNPVGGSNAWTLVVSGPYVFAGNGGLWALDASTGAAHPSFDPMAFDGRVRTVTVSGSSLYAGGEFKDCLIAFSSHQVDVPLEHSDSRVSLLSQNRPNPARLSTTIRFVLTEPREVALRVYDLAGREVSVLIAGERLEAGPHERRLETAGLPSGVYVYRLNAGR